MCTGAVSVLVGWGVVLQCYDRARPGSGGRQDAAMIGWRAL